MPETGNKPSSPATSICLSADGFSFCIHSQWHQQVFAHEDLHYHRCMALCLCEPSLQAGERGMRILFDSPYTTLFPADLFQTTEAERILRFLHPTLEQQDFALYMDRLPGCEVAVAFAVPQELQRFLSEQFPTCSLEHKEHTFLLHATQHSKQTSSRGVWVDISPRSVWIAYCTAKGLQFANRFPLQGEDDLLYYCGAIFEQFGLSQQTDSLYIRGDQQAAKPLERRVAHCIYQE